METLTIILLLLLIIAIPLMFWVGKFVTSLQFKSKLEVLQENLLQKESFFSKEIQELKSSNDKVLFEKESFYSKEIQELKLTNEKVLQQKESVLNEKESLTISNTQFQSEINRLNQKLTEQKEDLEKLNQKNKAEFEILAQKILEEKSEKFTQQNKVNLEQVLNPLKEKLKDFETKVDNTHKENIQQQSALKEQILGLKELNVTMSQETKNLTNALRKDTKLQGNWGELILEKVLEKSGLEKGREYTTQQSFNTEEGRKLPDVIIHLPDNKKLIVDSKVSLNAYNLFVNQEDETQQKQHLKQHISAIKTHVDTLSAKNYHQLYEMESPDFVLMFMPIETAFSSAINEEPQLYNYAFDKNIVIVTPSTLLATLKTVDTMWQNEKQRKNTVEIAYEGGKLYDKFEGLLNELVILGKQIDTAKNTYSNSMKKLTGSGNLISKVEKLKKLGVKANKQISQNLIDRSNDE